MAGTDPLVRADGPTLTPGPDGPDVDLLTRELTGLDHLELELPTPPSLGRRSWSAAWPKAAAVVIAGLVWQIVVWTGWKPTFVLPGPIAALRTMVDDRAALLPGTATTLGRAVALYILALAVGTVLAVVITRNRTLRSAVSPIVSGAQTMPNVAWVPVAVVLFGVGTLRPIIFVALIGTVPAIIIATMSAIDAVPPVLLRAGRVLGARGIAHYRHVVLPAALPGYVAGMKQGWAFLWRSLMAGELIAPVAGTHALGQLLASYQDQSDDASVIATMLAILAVGLLMDTVVFSRLERSVLVRRGLRPAGSGT